MWLQDGDEAIYDFESSVPTMGLAAGEEVVTVNV
jgi:hypothetical protein